MRRWQRRLLLLGGVAVIIIALRLTLFAPEPVSVTVRRVDRGRVEDTVVNSRAGTVESRLRAKMSPAIAGQVTAIPVEKGQRVTKNQVLLRLDDSEHAAQVSLAARSVDAAAAASREACLTADQAERDRKRAEALAEQTLLSDERLEDARTQADVARAACEAAQERRKQAQAALATARAALAKTVMKAPFDGVILDITTEVGEWISPSPPGVYIPPVMDLISPESLYVSAPIDEADIARIAVGLPARITMDAFRGMSFPAIVSYVASYVETRQQQNRTLDIEAVFDQEDLPANLIAGISADVEVIMDAREDVLRIPTYALLEGSRVLVVEGGSLHERKVETGLKNWEYTEVTAGLEEGERVVVSLDRPEVRAGARVEVAPEPGQ